MKKSIGNVPKVKKKLKCKGRAYVVNENIVKFIKHNNHVPNASKIEVKKAVSHI